MASHSTGDGSIPSREASSKGLKRIMTVGGAYGTRNYTVKDLRDLKGKRVLVETVCFTPEEAEAAEEAGIDTMKVRFDPKNPDPAIAVRKAAPNTFMAFSVPLVAAASETEAIKIAYEAMKIGADAVMTQWSPRLISAVTEAGVPVQAHAGLVPRRSTWTGGLKAVGKTVEEATWVYRQTKTFEDAGAYAVEVEVIPEELLAELTKRTKLLTSSIGAGGGGDSGTEESAHPRGGTSSKRAPTRHPSDMTSKSTRTHAPPPQEQTRPSPLLAGVAHYPGAYQDHPRQTEDKGSLGTQMSRGATRELAGGPDALSLPVFAWRARASG